MRMAQSCSGLGTTVKGIARRAEKHGRTRMPKTSEPRRPRNGSKSCQAPSQRSLGQWARARTAKAKAKAKAKEKEKEKERAKARRAKVTRTGRASNAIPEIVHGGMSASTRTVRAARRRAARLLQQCSRPSRAQCRGTLKSRGQRSRRSVSRALQVLEALVG